MADDSSTYLQGASQGTSGIPIFGGILGLAGGVAGAAQSADDRNKALQQNQAAVQNWLNLNVPDPSLQRVALQQYVSTGSFTPDLQQAISQGPSAMQGVQANQQDQQAQLRALDTLQQLGSNGGMTLADQANVQNAMNQTNAANSGRIGAIQQGMAARGLGGSGLDLQAQLSSVQSANQSTNNAQMQSAASAQQRALDAIMGGGQLAGSMRNQDFGEQAQKAQAADSIARFNAQNANQVAGANVNRQNSGQLYNLQNNQNISNMNTGVGNQQEMYNKGLYQQAYGNQLAKAQGLSGQQNNMGNVYRNQGDQTAQQYANIGAGAGQAVNAYGQYSQNQDRINAYNNRTNAMGSNMQDEEGMSGIA